MKVLVVGGNRFVGREVVNRLLVEGHEVTVLALDPLPAPLASHARLVRADRNSRGELERGLGGASFDAVVDNIAFEPSQVELLADVLRGRFSRYVLTSSVDIYGLSHPRARRESQAPLEPNELAHTEGHDRYVRGKRGCEVVVRRLDVPWTVVRPGIVTGRLDNVAPPPLTRHLAPEDEGSRSLFFAARVQDGGPILLRDDLQGVFRLAWVQDVARAITTSLVDARMERRAFNVVGDELWTTERHVRALAVAAGRTPELVTVSARELEAAGLGDYDGPYGRGPYWSAAENGSLRALGFRFTPATEWMPKLLESAAAPGGRPSYERRLQEIALAHHVRRTRGAEPEVRPLPIERPTRAKRVVSGRLAVEASRAYAASHAGLHPSHFREVGGARVSSLGVGTWMGDLSPETDAAYVDAVVHAVRNGLNVVDTAINYRHMLSERAVGRAIRRLESLGVPRSSLLVATKGGFVTFDAADPRTPHDQIRGDLVERGLLSSADWSRGHSVEARFIRAMLLASLANLGLASVDVYFLHNPELALAHEDRRTFDRRITETFALLESAAVDGRIGAYGVATWAGLRAPEDDASHLSLAGLVDLATIAAGGDDHHFRFVELPFNAAMAEAQSFANQRLGRSRLPALACARELGLQVFTSATLHQGAVERSQALGDLTRAQTALQFARSTAGVTTALVGLRRLAHVDELAAVAKRDCAVEPPAALAAGAGREVR